jgi:hypothetical protein
MLSTCQCAVRIKISGRVGVCIGSIVPATWHYSILSMARRVRIKGYVAGYSFKLKGCLYEPASIPPVST